MQGFALFATPIFVFEPAALAPLCPAITQALLEEWGRAPGIAASNQGGAWHSRPDLASRHEGPWQQVAGIINEGVRAVFDELAAAQGTDTRGRVFDHHVQMWGMVMPKGGYSVLHDHHDAGWSVALYADAGQPAPPPSGHLAFVDPRHVPPTSGGVTLFPSTFTVQPSTGMLIVFPGWLQHYVHPYQGERPRVSVSANVRLY